MGDALAHAMQGGQPSACKLCKGAVCQTTNVEANDRHKDTQTPVTPQEISPSHSYTAESSSLDVSSSAASCPGQASSCQLPHALPLLGRTQQRLLQNFSLRSMYLRCLQCSICNVVKLRCEVLGCGQSPAPAWPVPECSSWLIGAGSDAADRTALVTLGVCWLLKVTPHPGGKCISVGAPSIVLTHMKSKGAVCCVRQAITCT